MYLLWISILNMTVCVIKLSYVDRSLEVTLCVVKLNIDGIQSYKTDGNKKRYFRIRRKYINNSRFRWSDKAYITGNKVLSINFIHQEK